MLLAPVLGEPPRAIAERLARRSQERLGDGVERVEVAGPGFLNLFLADAWYVAGGRRGARGRRRFGAGGAARSRERVQVEFVSANPTGPLTSASGRNAAYGDALARMLEFAGTRVEREYYVNDGGGQVQRLGESIHARARGEEPPEDGYQGEYVAELAAADPGRRRARVADVAPRGASAHPDGAHPRDARALPRARSTTGSSRRRCTRATRAPWERARERRSRRAGRSYEAEGALWLRTTDLGDDKDRVLVRSTRRADLLRRRHRLPLGQARPRLRPPDQRAGRRPPRLRRPA